jgi:TonB family protein
MPGKPASGAALGVIVLSLLSCSRQDDAAIKLADHSTPVLAAPPEEPPVAINPVSPVRYPRGLLEQGIEGRVLLLLYVDSLGKLVSDSTRIAESSGYPALDSAALSAAPQLRFSPALHQGHPISTPFIQPVHFRNPRAGSTPE